MKRVRNAAAPPARRSVARRRPAVPKSAPARGEQIMLLPGSWRRYQMLDKEFTGTGIRVTYLKGLIEVMSVSPLHERIKTNLRRLVEDYCLHTGIQFYTRGGPTSQKHGDRGGEPDESFSFEAGTGHPQLVIEVALTSGGLDKLEFWSGFPIEEVWVWKKRKLHFFRWQDTRYAEVTESSRVPGFKKSWAERFAESEVTSDMIRAFRALL